MIQNIRQAIYPATQCININHQKDWVTEILPANKGRHYFLKTYKGLTYWLLYKRDFFRSFGKIFGYKGLGESINKEWVERAINKHKITAFIFVYSQGHVYIVPPEEFKKFAEKNNTIRRTNATGEITYSVPISFLRRWKVR